MMSQDTHQSLLRLDAARSNLRLWSATAPQTGLWADLPDEDLARRLRIVSHTKRFVERYCVDPAFRLSAAQDTRLAAAHCGVELDEDTLAALATINGGGAQPAHSMPDNVRLYVEFARERLDWHELRDMSGASSNARFVAWRERQIARTRFELPPLHGERSVHIPVSFELSKGCSVGCNFCGFSAPRLEGHFLYTPANARLWREVLEVVHGLLGRAAGAGFCYWATDPLDNPDYERFVLDFHRSMGTFPQTTTAQPLKDVPRLRHLLATALGHGCKLNRISILSPGILARVHRLFAPEELAFVGIVPMSPGVQNLVGYPFQATPIISKTRAGRWLDHPRNPQFHEDEPGSTSTIACVSGFLFNMVERSVKLISPCASSPRWRNGYIILDEATFEDAGGLAATLEAMISQHMPQAIRESDSIRLRSGLRYAPLLNGFSVTGAWHSVSVRHPFIFPGLVNCLQLGEFVRSADMTAEQIVQAFASNGVSRESVLDHLNSLLRSGVLDIDPAPAGSEAPRQHGLATPA
jgi:radical SAM family RiPP maturation amino acid epimerase